LVVGTAFQHFAISGFDVTAYQL